MHCAFSRVGFAYLSGHGIDEDTIAEAFELWQSFFEDYTVEEKEAAFPRDPVTTQGYVKPSSEMLDALKEEDGEPAEEELRESLDVNRVDESSPFPDEVVPKMRDVFKNIKSVLEPLALRVYRAVALSLGLDKEFFVKLHKHMIAENNSSKLRSLYYPPIKGLYCMLLFFTCSVLPLYY